MIVIDRSTLGQFDAGAYGMAASAIGTAGAIATTWIQAEAMEEMHEHELESLEARERIESERQATLLAIQKSAVEEQIARQASAAALKTSAAAGFVERTAMYFIGGVVILGGFYLAGKILLEPKR